MNLKKSFIAVATLIIFCFIFSFKFKLIDTDKGAYRINQITGNVVEINGTTPNLLQQKKYKQPKMWNEIKIDKDKITCQLITKWQNGVLYYDIISTPFSGNLKKQYESYNNSKLMIVFTDDFGFAMKIIDVPIRSMTGMLGTSGKLESLEKKGSVKMTLEEIESVNAYEIQWNF